MSKESKKNKEQAKKNPTEEEEFSIDVDKAENLKEDSDNSNEQKSKKEEEPKDPLKEALRQDFKNSNCGSRFLGTKRPIK